MNKGNNLKTLKRV